MTADNQVLEVTLTEDLSSGQIQVRSNKPMTFNIALRLYLVALKGLKNNLLAKVNEMSREDIIKYSFGEAFQEQANAQLPEDETELKGQILAKMEGDMYDMLNISVGNFLDEEFPLVNISPSLTEEAAAAAGLDRTASDEELVKAEMDFIKDNPEAAAQCQEMQPTEVKQIPEEFIGYSQEVKN